VFAALVSFAPALCRDGELEQGYNEYSQAEKEQQAPTGIRDQD